MYKDTYHSPAWVAIRDQLWLTDPKWQSLDESMRLGFLCHLACDSGVPLNHDPSGGVWSSSVIEPMLEARVETWTTSPDITPYTGTYANKMDTFYAQQIALANWAHDNLTVWTVLGSKG